MDSMEESVELLWQELKFTVMVLRSPAVKFEDIFTQIMRAAYPDSFHVARAAGPRGDERCDGWDSNTKTLYSVYAPFSAVKPSRASSKISSDFRGAKQRWPEMRRWRFVHNDFFGLAAQVTRELELLRGNPDSRGIDILPDWDPEQLWRIARGLPNVDRRRILGSPEWLGSLVKGAFDSSTLRYHENAHPASARAAVRSLSRLYENFQSDSVLNERVSSALAGVLISWWMNDESLFREYTEVLYGRSDSMPFETELTCLAFAVRCVEICARRLSVPTGIFIASQLDESSSMRKSQKMILELVDDILEDRNPGFSIDDPPVRRNFISACCGTITDLIGITSAGGFPAIFTLQDLLISLQRIDHDGGSFVL